MFYEEDPATCCLPRSRGADRRSRRRRPAGSGRGTTAAAPERRRPRRRHADVDQAGDAGAARASASARGRSGHRSRSEDDLLALRQALPHRDVRQRKWARVRPATTGSVRPFGYVNVYCEIYQQNEKYIWVWVEEHDIAAEAEAQRQAAERQSRYRRVDSKYFKRHAPQFSPLDAADARQDDHASTSRPTAAEDRLVAQLAGSRRHERRRIPRHHRSARARTAANVPAIFLGDGKGHWKCWAGEVAARSRLRQRRRRRLQQRRPYGSGLRRPSRPASTSSSATARATSPTQRGLPHDFPTRRVVVADVDHDGYPDLVAISEGPTRVRRASPANGGYAKIRAYLNRNKGKTWEGINIAGRRRENSAATGCPPATSTATRIRTSSARSIFFSSPDILYLSNGPNEVDQRRGPRGILIPLLAYYRATTTGKISSKKHDDAIISVLPPLARAISTRSSSRSRRRGRRRHRPHRLQRNGAEARAGHALEHSRARTLAGNGTGRLRRRRQSRSWRSPIMESREVVILLGDGKGNFKKAAVSGVKVDSNPIYDLRVADVNGDGHPDLIMGYESGGHRSAIAMARSMSSSGKRSRRRRWQRSRFEAQAATIKGEAATPLLPVSGGWHRSACPISLERAVGREEKRAWVAPGASLGIIGAIFRQSMV